VDPGSGADRGPGKPGELWFRGRSVMKGYLHDREATAVMIDEDGWCRTGDIAQIDADDFVRITDRVNEMIRYKG
jgi:long-subunit acyl-CoA synthetase (AMP-forming)